ncbi:MAG: hypothetical protein ACM3S2_16795 [Ignavibacteriales bacterium]
MNKNQIEGLLGSVILLIGGFVPIAVLQHGIITYFPVWGNLRLENGLWSWRDISFFAVTLGILGVVSFVFALRKKYSGLIFSGILSLFVSIIIFISIFFIKANLNVWAGDDSLRISWGWLFLLAGPLLIILGGYVNRYRR